MKALTGKEMLKLLRKYGWVVERIHGSHYIHTKPGREEIVSVPVHGNRTLKMGIQREILKVAGIDVGK